MEWSREKAIKMGDLLSFIAGSPRKGVMVERKGYKNGGFIEFYSWITSEKGNGREKRL